MINEILYKKQILAFLDILGFKNHVKSATTNKKMKKIVTVLKTAIKNAVEKNLNNRLGGDKLPEIFRYKIFSDSIVVSADCNNEDGNLDDDYIFYFLMTLIYIQSEIIHYGFFLRGAVAIDNHYEDDKVVFSPALIKAHELESTIAFYPRIILDKKLVDEIFNTFDDADYKTWDAIVKLDADKQYFINYLTYVDEIPDVEEQKRYLKDHKELVLNEILKYNDPKIISKFLWLAKYHNSTIEYFFSNSSEELKIDESYTAYKNSSFKIFSVVIMYYFRDKRKVSISIYENFQTVYAREIFKNRYPNARIHSVKRFTSEQETRKFIHGLRKRYKIKKIETFEDKKNLNTT
jgi:hypothetical protein